MKNNNRYRPGAAHLRVADQKVCAQVISELFSVVKGSTPHNLEEHVADCPACNVDYSMLVSLAAYQHRFAFDKVRKEPMYQEWFEDDERNMARAAEAVGLDELLRFATIMYHVLRGLILFPKVSFVLGPPERPSEAPEFYRPKEAKKHGIEVVETLLANPILPKTERDRLEQVKGFLALADPRTPEVFQEVFLPGMEWIANEEKLPLELRGRAKNNVALAWQHLGQEKKALETYKSLQNHPSNRVRSIAMNNVGNLYMRRGELEEAKPYFIDALTAQPRAVPALNLAIIEASSPRPNHRVCRAYLKQALTLDSRLLVRAFEINDEKERHLIEKLANVLEDFDRILKEYGLSLQPDGHLTRVRVS